MKFNRYEPATRLCGAIRKQSKIAAGSPRRTDTFVARNIVQFQALGEIAGNNRQRCFQTIAELTR
jgi:hypothetical protein